MYMTGLFTYKS